MAVDMWPSLAPELFISPLNLPTGVTQDNAVGRGTRLDVDLWYYMQSSCANGPIGNAVQCQLE